MRALVDFFTPLCVFCTSLTKVDQAVSLRRLQRRMIELLNTISRQSQPFVSCQSRKIVSGAKLRTSAVSWTLSPPKKAQENSLEIAEEHYIGRSGAPSQS